MEAVGIEISGLAILLAIILISMMLHELAHGGVAYLLGDDTAKEDGRLTLNPLKHLDPVMSVLVPVVLYLLGGPIFGGAKPVPVNSRRLRYGEWGMALVAIAGPLTNFLLALLAFLLGVWAGWFLPVAGTVLYLPNNIASTICMQFILVNLGFGIFNLIPIPPLDGSRVLYALAPDFARGFLEAMERYGMMIVLVLVCFGGTMFSNLMNNGIYGVLHGFCFLVGAG